MLWTLMNNKMSVVLLLTNFKDLKVVEDADLDEVAAHVKEHPSSVTTIKGKLDILILQEKLRHEHWTKQEILSPGWKLSRAEAANWLVT